MLSASAHFFLCLPLLLLPSTVPHRMVFPEAVDSYNTAIQFHFPLLNCYQEGFVVACGLSDGAAHFFVCDVVQVGDAEDSLICSISAQLFASFSADLFIRSKTHMHKPTERWKWLEHAGVSVSLWNCRACLSRLAWALQLPWLLTSVRLLQY